jgi:hypothetical protein
MVNYLNGRASIEANPGAFVRDNPSCVRPMSAHYQKFEP